MSFLCADDIRNLIDNMDMVTNITNEQYSFIEGSSLDLSVNEIFYIHYVQVPYIGTKERDLPSVLKYSKDEDGKGYSLMPGYYIVQSFESVKLPGYIGGIVYPRTSLFNCGCLLGCSRIAPGFDGRIRCGMFVWSPMGLNIDVGARFATVMFHRFSPGKTDIYKGVWSGDAVTQEGKVRAF